MHINILIDEWNSKVECDFTADLKYLWGSLLRNNFDLECENVFPWTNSLIRQRKIVVCRYVNMQVHMVQGGTWEKETISPRSTSGDWLFHHLCEMYRIHHAECLKRMDLCITKYKRFYSTNESICT